MRYKKYILLIVFLFVAGSQIFYSEAQVKKIVRSVVKKETTKYSAKALKKSTRKILKQEMKALKVKSIAALGVRKSNMLHIKPSALRYTRSSIGKSFTTVYNTSVKNGVIPPKLMYDKTLIRAGMKEVSVPKGRASLKVVWDPIFQKKVPYLKNMEDNTPLAKEFNKQLLIERRKAIAPHNQFPTIDQLSKYDKKKLILGKEGNGEDLRKNMFAVMDPEDVRIAEGFGGTAAHHIIEGNDKSMFAEKSRKLLKKFDIDINAPENGILLPTDEKSIFKGIQHKTNHSKEYSEAVYLRLKEAKNKKEAIEIMQEIKHDLYNGKLTLKPSAHKNKNKL